MSDQPQQDSVTGEFTTGHEWDGIEELNTPMPRWWLWIFYATIIFSIGYCIAMPAIPLLKQATPGVLGEFAREDVMADMAALKAEREEFAVRLDGASLEDIRADDELFRFAMASGKSAFGDNCATCHGSGAQGFPGYPNLNDDVWLWGGSFEEIRNSIRVGIRSTHSETRMSLMQAYGRDGFLTRDEIRDVAEYITSISGGEGDAKRVPAGAAIYAENCVSCHGETGLGDRSQGVPNLTDQEWLYGGDIESLVATLYGGRAGVMPQWEERLDAHTITALALYVHALGGGETSLPTSGDTESLD
jgi:cytochrome c oxidase cbb3-type subunit 3